MNDGVSSMVAPGVRRSINFGYLVLPNYSDVESLIDKCLRTRRFSVLIEKGGGIIHDCFALESAIKDFSFPKFEGELGSPVAFMQEPLVGKGIIIGVINSNNNRKFFNEKQYVIEKFSDDCYAAVIVDGEGVINIDVLGNNKGAMLNINVANKESSSEVNLNVKGKVTIDVDGDINLRSNFNDVKIQGREILFSPKRLKIGSGEQPMVKGRELKNEIEKTNEVVNIIKDALLNWVVVPSDGGEALQLYITGKLSGKELGKFDKINSDQSFLE